MPIILSSSLASAPSAFSWGWDQNVDLGTAADFYVDGVNGSNVNDGLTSGTAFETIAKAITEGVGGENIAVIGNGVKYREMPWPKSGTAGNPTKIFGFGTDRPIITAANVLDSLVACGSSDDAIIGAANVPNCFKQTLTISTLREGGFGAQDPRWLNLFENDERLHICREWGAGDPVTTRLQTKASFDKRFWLWNNADWLTATEVQTTEGDISGYKLLSVTNSYTKAQIERAYVIGHASPNANFIFEISEFDTATDSILLEPTGVSLSGNDNENTFILVNILPNIQQGEWGYINNGDGTATVYVYPNNSANVAAGLIEYTKRSFGINVTDRDHIHLEGLDVRQSSGEGTRDGSCIANYTNTKATGLTIRNCRVSGTSVDNRRALANFSNVDNAVFEYNTIENGQGSFGTFFQGGGTTQAENLVYRRNFVRYIENTGPRFYTQKGAIVAHSKFQYCGLAAHANKTNFYQSSQALLYYGNVFIDCDGFMTHQASSDIFVLFNYVPATYEAFSGNNSAAYRDQNKASLDSPTAETNSIFANNSFLPHPVGTDLSTVTNGLNLGQTSANHSQVLFEVVNNYFHGASGTLQGQCPVFDYNLNSATDGAYGTNDQTAAITSIFTDPVNGVFTVPAGSPLRTANTTSINDYIENILKPRFGSRFTDWNLDALGDTITPLTPVLGCLVDPNRYNELNGVLYFD